MTTRVRLEYMTPDGVWAVGHADIELLHPERYVERLAGNGKIGRATDLNTGQVWEGTPAMLPGGDLL